MVNPKDRFKITTSKWHKIANAMNANGHSPLLQNDATCKNEWGALYGDFKCIFYYMSLTRNNTLYWDFTSQEKTNQNVF